MPTGLRFALGPHHEPLSCRPPHTKYGFRMSALIA